MVSHCVNPACDAPFRYLRGGRLFLVDCPSVLHSNNQHPQPHTVHLSEFFWLCEKCSQGMRVMLDKTGDVILVAGEQPQQVLRSHVPQVEDDLCAASADAGVA
jgi:hypothetical protein